MLVHHHTMYFVHIFIASWLLTDLLTDVPINNLERRAA